MFKQQRSSLPDFVTSLHTLIIVLFIHLILLNSARADTGAKVTIQNDGIKAIATVSDVTAMQLRVAGPGDFYEAVRSEDAQVSWYAPKVLKDGGYRYEVFITVGYEEEHNLSLIHI